MLQHYVSCHFVEVACDLLEIGLAALARHIERRGVLFVLAC
jgi:hypothetical protein